MTKTITGKSRKAMPYSDIIKSGGGNPKSASREKPAMAKGSKSGAGGAGAIKAPKGRSRGYGGKGM